MERYAKEIEPINAVRRGEGYDAFRFPHIIYLTLSSHFIFYVSCLCDIQAIVAEKLNVQTKRMAAFQQSSTSLQSVKDIIVVIKEKLNVHRTVFTPRIFYI